MERPPEATSGLGHILERLISSKTVIGEPITVQGTTIVPVLDVAFGFGTSSGGAPAVEREPLILSSGVISGAKMTPRAVIVVRAGEVEIYPLAAQAGQVERILDKLPQVAESIMAEIREAKTPTADCE